MRVVSGITRAGQLDGYLDEARAGTLADRAIGEGPLALYLAVDPPDRFVTLSLWGGWSHVEAATGADHEHVDRTRHAERLVTWTAEHYEVIPGLAVVDPAPAEAGAVEVDGAVVDGVAGCDRRRGHRPHRGRRLGQRRLPPPKIVSNTPRISDWPARDVTTRPAVRIPVSIIFSRCFWAAAAASRSCGLALALGRLLRLLPARAPGARSRASAGPASSSRGPSPSSARRGRASRLSAAAVAAAAVARSPAGR